MVNFPSCMLPLESGQKDIAKNMNKLKFYNVEVFTKDYYKINNENEEVLKENFNFEERCDDDSYLEEEDHCDDDLYSDEEDNYDDNALLYNL
jgi:hypothetical protein